MNTKNTELTESQDLELTKFERGEITEDQLSDEMKSLLNGEEPKEIEEEEEEIVVDKPKEEESTTKGGESKVKTKKYFADLANKYKQSHDSLQRKLEEAKKDPESFKKLLSEFGVESNDYDLGDDPLSDESIKSMHKNMLKMQIDSQAQKILDAEKQKAELEMDSTKRLFGEIGSLQESYPELQTDMSVEDINAVILSLGGQNIPKEKLLQNGISEKDFKNYNSILSLKKLKDDNKLPDFEVALFKSGKYNEIIKSRFDKGVKGSADKLNEDAFARKANEMKAVPRNGRNSSSSGSHSEDGSISQSYIEQILDKADKHGADKLSSGEMEALDTYMAKLKQ